MANHLENEHTRLTNYVQDHALEEAVHDILVKLLHAKPENPKEWLLGKLEEDLSNTSGDLSESNLHRLFASARKITSEVVPQDAIDCVIRETLALLNCDRVSLFVFDKKMKMLRLYASNLATPIMVSPGQGIVGTVFNRQETVNIQDCYSSDLFDKSFDQKTGYVTTSLIAVPILDFEGQTVGVLQAINKLPTDQPDDYECPKDKVAIVFDTNDEKLLTHLSQHAGIAMRNAEVYREAISTCERSTGLLNTIQSLSQDLGTQSMLLTITMHANKIVSCERATVFLVDETNGQLWSVSTDTGEEIRIPKNKGIAGLCYTEAKVINIPDAYADSRFNQAVDKKTGFKTQSILAIPMVEDCAARAALKEAASKRRSLLATLDQIMTNDNKVIGVIQMINKVSFDGQTEIFDEQDVEVMELFAQTVGPKLALSSMLSKRGNQNSERKEAEMALTTTSHLPSSHTHTNHRSSQTGLLCLGEVDEEEN